MLAAEPATTPPHLHHPKSSGRKPLQPKNTFFITSASTPKPKPFPQPIINVSTNKENIDFQSFDASLAEELTVVKQKLERIKLDRDNTDKLLQHRDRILETHFTELLHRGELQKELEIEVDRLYRLKQLHSASMRSSPILSLREKETEKKKKTPTDDTVAGEKSRERKEVEMEIKDDESSTTESLGSCSASASASTSTSSSSKSTGTWKIVLSIPLKLSLLETHVDDHNITESSG